MASRLVWYKWRGLHPERHHMHGVCAALNPKHLKIELLQHQTLLQSCQRLPNRWQLRTADWIQLIQQWRTLTTVGFDQQKCWQLLRDRSRNQRLASGCQHIISGIQQGQSISAAMRQLPRVFPSWLIPWIESGEQSGQLGSVLGHLAATLSVQLARQRQLQQAMRYPLMVLGLAFLMLVLMLQLLVPRFATIYADMDRALPPLTALVIQWSAMPWSLMVGVPLLILGSLAIGAHVLKRLLRQRSRWQEVCYRLPGLGRWWCERHLYDDLVMVQLGLQSQMNLVQLCDLQAQYSASSYWRQQWQHARQQLQQGRPWSLSWQSTLAPELLLAAIAIGEESGQLLEQLRIATQELGYSVEQFAQRLHTVIPACALSVVSLIVMLILLAIYLPLFQLAGAVAV
ncbi:type II secretion system F family protein [Aliidiomarina haloalkalitolerans]|uniref:General secretion pathway protein F n=1 Tax=Aliidiomarina haloalkalitolerans TaxID=859059 RepID=A0A432VSU8_9GAMM|nr:type II secretion system F family protein [Aliidiomarina haloalkalitolerans]RUO19498.1 hypothetical protein CWE06_08185 [Aliidiomarina haloalkalitolerans]